MTREELLKIINEEEGNLKAIYKEVEDTSFYFSNLILEAFKMHKVSETCFTETTGYGYNDFGRETIEKIYASIFHAEDALVRNQFISGSHALSVTLFALLRPGDTLLSITGTPYDTLHEVIGIRPNASSLQAYDINYREIDLLDNDFDYQKISDFLEKNPVKVIAIQRSKGYSKRESLTIDKLKPVIDMIKKKYSDIIIMVDNCYTELVEKSNPIEIGADLCVGSLIKNLGGGIAQNGAYVVGKKHLIGLVSERLTLPGEGKDVGPSLGANKFILQGLFFAPSVVASSLKTAILAAKVMQRLGYEVSPKYNDPRADIVQNIIFNDPSKLIAFVQGIQGGSPIDAHALPLPWDMPGYQDQVIMASGSFTQGSSIELSCDGPIREPFIAYMQGGLTYEYGKLGLINAILYLYNKEKA